MGRPKKEVEEIKIEEVKEVKKASSEKATAKDEKIKELESELLELKEMMSNLLKTSSVQPKTYSESLEYIPIVSQTAGELILTTLGRGQGRVYRMSKFGEIIKVPFNDLKDIVMNNREMTDKGYFYILDNQAVSELYLDATYENLINTDEIVNIFNKDTNKIIEIYTTANEHQQHTIETLIRDKILNNESVDANLVNKIENITHRKIIAQEY